MFHSISWSTYFTALGIGLLLYYAIVAFKFYRVDIIGLWKRGQETFPAVTHRNDTTLFPLVHECMDELHQCFAHAAQQQHLKEEVLMAIQIILQRYAPLKGTAFQVAINHYIPKESERQCSIRLEEEEVKRVWDR